MGRNLVVTCPKGIPKCLWTIQKGKQSKAKESSKIYEENTLKFSRILNYLKNSSNKLTNSWKKYQISQSKVTQITKTPQKMKPPKELPRKKQKESQNKRNREKQCTKKVLK